MAFKPFEISPFCFCFQIFGHYSFSEKLSKSTIEFAETIAECSHSAFVGALDTNFPHLTPEPLVWADPGKILHLPQFEKCARFVGCRSAV